MSRPRTLSLRWIVTGATVVLVAAAVAGVTAVYDRAARRALTAQVESSLLLRARQLASASSGALLTDFPELTLQPMVRGIQARQPELALLVVHDRAGVLQGHPDPRAIGTRYEAPRNLRPVATDEALRPGESLRGNDSLLIASAPVLHPGGAGVLGAVRVGVRRAWVAGLLDEARAHLMFVFALFSGASIGVAFLLVSLLLRPLGAVRAGIDRIARGDLDSPLQIKDRTELGRLAEAVNDMASRLKAAQAEMLERERLATEMSLARNIQRSLLPRASTAAGRFLIDGDQWAAAEVGGDWYDVLELKDGRIGIAMADVAGKGLAGCLVTSMLAALVRALRHVYDSPAELLATVDEHLAETLPPGNFVTMWYGVLDPDQGDLTWASAGHNPSLIVRADGRLEWPKSKGIPLGAIRGGMVRLTLRDDTLRLGPGDLLVQYTDGVNEAFAPGGDDTFGTDRMSGVVTTAAALGPRGIVDEVHRAVAAWRGDGPPHDDETLVVVQHTGPPAARLPGDARKRALDRLAEARRGGRRLRLDGSLEGLERLGGWILEQPELRGLEGEALQRLEVALHEACANVVEHGYGGDASRSFDVFWMPENGAPGTGAFVLCDQGPPFRADNWKASDFSDPDVRRRGRGFGLDILHRVMREVVFEPGTPEGNVTVLTLAPAEQRADKEARHA